MTDDPDDCPVCRGTGEIEALPDGEVLPCPACVLREKDAEIDRFERELAAANAETKRMTERREDAAAELRVANDALRVMARGLAEMGTEVERLKAELDELNNVLSRPGQSEDERK